MKLTTKKLRELIKEELQNLKEDPFATTAPTNDPFSGKKTAAGPSFDPKAKQKAASADPFSGKKTAAGPGFDPNANQKADPFSGGKTAAGPGFEPNAKQKSDPFSGVKTAATPVKAIKTLDARMDQVEALLKQLLARLNK